MDADSGRFTRMQKVAIFLIALGEERSREILADVDLDTLEQVNNAIASLGKVTAAQKAGVMLEFAHFFYEDKPLGQTPRAGGGAPVDESPDSGSPGGGSPGGGSVEPASPASDEPLDLGCLSSQQETSASQAQEEEQAILHTLEHLRRRLDPDQIDWSGAGYDFGDGFKGPSPDRQ